MKATSYGRILRFRVDEQIYVEILDEARRRKLSLSDVMRHAMVERYWPGQTAPPIRTGTTEPAESRAASK